MTDRGDGGTGPGPLTGFDWLRLATVPRLSDVPDPRRWVAASIAAAVVSSHAELLDSSKDHRQAGSNASDQRAGLAVAWVRPPGADRAHFLLGGRPSFPPRRGRAERSWAGTNEAVTFPPGATAEPLDGVLARDWLTQLPVWFRCLGTIDVEPLDPRREGAEGEPPAGLDDYALHMAGPFAWLVVAEPVGRDVLEEEAAATGAQLTTIRKRESSESHRVDLERGQRRIRELTRARANGLWRVHVLAGALGDVRARQAAALLCGALDTARTGYVLFPGDKAGTLDALWASSMEGADRAASPMLAGSDLVAALVRPPVRELPGIRLLTPHGFDVTPLPESSTANGLGVGSAVELGEVLDEALSPVGRFEVPFSTINRHGFICGATGSGKSRTARRLLESLSTGPRRIPWLVIEPAKAEYAAMAGRLSGHDDVLVIRPGALDAAPASLNPLEPEPGFPLQSHADLVRELFLAAFEATEPFPQVLSHALTECYTAAGWSLVTGRLRQPVKPKYRIDEPDEAAVPRYPTLRELQATARTVVDNIGYGDEIAANVRGFVDVRMGSLRQGTPGRFFEGGHPLDMAALMQRNTVLELEAITNDQDKAFLIGTVLIRLVEHLRVRQHRSRDEGLDHVVLIEEAHRLLKNVHEGPAAAAVEQFASLLAEIRAYGEGVVVVEQIPSKILVDVVKNTAFKVMHRLPAKDDRDVVGATMNLTDHNSEAVVSFPPGIAAISVDGDDRPLLVGIDSGLHHEDPTLARIDPPLCGRRSLLCGTDCQNRACTLAEIDQANTIADHPAVVIWAEAVAASMICGRRAPFPRDHITRGWPASDRIGDCALATLADRAVDARRSQLAPWVAPDDFAVHLHGLLALLVAGTLAVHREPDRWRAGPFRWQYAYSALAMANEATGPVDSGPHRDTEAWRSRGLDLDALTTHDQFEQLETHPAYTEGGEQVLLGDTNTSGLHQGLVNLAGSTTPTAVRLALQHCTQLAADDPLLERLEHHFIGRPRSPRTES
jgi:hypothetical protein